MASVSSHDLTGKVFGKLQVIERVANAGKKVRYRVRCECGRETVVYASNLRRGATRSCGCGAKGYRWAFA